VLHGVVRLAAARGIYGVLDELVTPARAQAAVVARFQEQYLIDKLQAVLDNGVTAVIPPIYNHVFTAKLASGVTWDRTTLRAARTRLEAALAKVEAPYPATAAGLTIVVAWGLPYPDRNWARRATSTGDTSPKTSASRFAATFWPRHSGSTARRNSRGRARTGRGRATQV
jgi:hypothetical protein